MSAIFEKIGSTITKCKARKKLFDTIVYVKAAFEGNFKEAEEQVVVLPEEDVRVFELFQFWLYSENFLDAGESIADIGASSLMEVAEEVPIAEIPRIYDNTLETSPLRRLIVDVSARTGLLRDSSWYGGDNNIRYNKTFPLDLALALYDENLYPGPQKISLNSAATITSMRERQVAVFRRNSDNDRAVAGRPRLLSLPRVDNLAYQFLPKPPDLGFRPPKNHLCMAPSD
ncbi:hypothetical protein MMC08_002636 [Hypocenomyce scalaris]|nr:hypothetical protein [Hypocenomyce scalaris]